MMSPARDSERAHVGIVLVSHSRRVAHAVVELAHQLAPDVAILAVGGDSDSGFGANAGEVMAACDELERSCENVIVIADLGSSVLAAEAALDYRRLTGKADSCVLARGPFLEGAIAASVSAQGNGTFAQVMDAFFAAEGAWRSRLLPIATNGHAHHRRDFGASPADSRMSYPAHPVASPAREASSSVEASLWRSTAGAHASADTGDEAASGVAIGADAGDGVGQGALVVQRVRVVDRAGLHARPAAMLAHLASTLGSEVFVNGVLASSMMEIMLLEVNCGDEVSVSGTEAADVQVLADAIAAGFIHS